MVKHILKKLYVFLSCTVLSLTIYGMPASISGLEEEIRSVVESNLLEHFTARSLILCAADMPGLAFNKAYDQKKMSQVKHFEAQYIVFLIDLAFKWYKKAPSEAMLREIMSELRSFYAQGLEKTLTPEENEYLESLISEVGTYLPKGSDKEAAEEEEQPE